MKSLQQIPIPKDSPSISLLDIQNVTPFYQGEFCNVFSISKDSKVYALKLVYIKKIPQSIRSDNLQRIAREIKALYALNHQSIIKLYGHFIDEFFVGLIFQKFGKPIGDYIREIKERKKKGQKKLPNFDDFVKIFRSIGSAISQVHSLGFVHRQICEDNILINENLQTKLIDFNSVGLIDYCYGRFGISEYIAPQILLQNVYNHKVDVWAFGILLYQLLYAVFVFKPKAKNLSQEQLDREYLKNMKMQTIQQYPDTKLILSQKPPQQALSHVKSLLSYNPDKRPQLGYLLSMKIFGAEDRAAQTYSISGYVRQKTYRKSHKMQGMMQSNCKDISVEELQQVLFDLAHAYDANLLKQIEIFTNFCKQQKKLAKAKVQNTIAKYQKSTFEAD